MRMNYTKVKPTVVKHVLPNEVMHIKNPEVGEFTEKVLLELFFRFMIINSICKRPRTYVTEDLSIELRSPICLELDLLRQQIDQLVNRVCDSNLDRVATRSRMPEI